MATRYEVIWRVCDGGAIFDVSNGNGPEGPEIRATELGRVEGPPLEVMRAQLMDQAYGELEVHLGLTPSELYKDPRPSWMGEFVWDPPLVTSGPAGRTPHDNP